MIPGEIKILDPWRVIEASRDGRARLLSDRLADELPEGHVLYGLKATALATRCDRDDVLFEVEGGTARLAVVHMTWRREIDPRWPTTKLFDSWDQWVREDMMPAHDEYLL
jgi:hypothetical protein